MKTKLFLIMVLFTTKTLAAPILELTKENWKTQLQGKTVLVFIANNCQLGGWAIDIFYGAMQDLNKKLNAIYLFNGTTKDETGQSDDFEMQGSAKILDNSFYSDGIRDNNYTDGTYNLRYSNAFANGFTIHVNIKLADSDNKQRNILFSSGSSFDFELYKDTLLFTSLLYDTRDLAVIDYYPLSETPFKVNQWNSIISGTDFTSRRLSIMVNGISYDDFYLSKYFMDIFNKSGLVNPSIRITLSTNGSLLNGYADDIVVYTRKLNISEMKALYDKFKKP